MSAAEERFWSYVDVSEDCWVWTGAKHGKGYGLFDKRWLGTARAHRISWIIHNGPIPTGMLVCHHCDNPPCINPNHLFIGSAKDNAQDARSKGRLRDMSMNLKHIGEENPASKLTAEKVRAIRRKRAEGALIKPLAREFGVSPHTIKQVLNGRNWSHVQ